MIKIFKATPYYESVLDHIYNQNPYLLTETYKVQHKAIMDFYFVWGDIWKTRLEETNHYEVEEIITNNEVLQKKWADENKVKYDKLNWLLDIVEAQILAFQPTIFFAHDYLNITPEFIKKIKIKCKCIKLVMSWDGIAQNNLNVYSQSDLILSCVPSVCDYYHKKGLHSFYMHFFFEETILSKIEKRNPLHDFTFVGSISQHNGLHNQRKENITELACKTSLKIWSPDKPEHGKMYKLAQRSRLLRGDFNNFWRTYRLGRSWQGSAFGLDMYQILQDSKVTFNCHGDKVPEFAANIRLWEATGAGTCLMTDWKENLKDFFEPDVEVITYKSIKECIDKVKYLLKDEDFRLKVSQAGQRKTLKYYSSQVVLGNLDRYLRNKVL